MPLNFFSEETTFRFRDIREHQRWIIKTIAAEKKSAEMINIIFCSDQYLLNINQEYLKRDEYTDVITFSNSDNKNILSGDIFISIDRVKENARLFKVALSKELRRVVIHGILHLCGYKDHTLAESRKMREKEDNYLSHFSE
jgi:probable rRNA maturation factor